METEQDQPRKKARQLRQCLGGCDRMFPSDGPQHRVCPDCRHRQAMLPTPEVVYDMPLGLR